jgi:hypothetical protein
MCDGGATTHAPACSTAQDCRLFAIYCPNASNDCTCDVLALTDPNPVCDAGGSDCLVDPCNGHTAICDSSMHCAMQ